MGGALAAERAPFSPRAHPALPDGHASAAMLMIVVAQRRLDLRDSYGRCSGCGRLRLDAQLS